MDPVKPTDGGRQLGPDVSWAKRTTAPQALGDMASPSLQPRRWCPVDHQMVSSAIIQGFDFIHSPLCDYLSCAVHFLMTQPPVATTSAIYLQVPPDENLGPMVYLSELAMPRQVMTRIPRHNPSAAINIMARRRDMHRACMYGVGTLDMEVLAPSRQTSTCEGWTCLAGSQVAGRSGPRKTSKLLHKYVSIAHLVEATSFYQQEEIG